jgi:hypothetical protein
MLVKIIMNDILCGFYYTTSRNARRCSGLHKNEGTRKINLVLYKNNYNLQRFKPPEREPRYSMNRRRGGPQNRSGCQATAPEHPKEKARFYIDVVAK